jgi:predicted nuclease of restriction endonuclease-like (RecB) superfamily
MKEELSKSSSDTFFENVAQLIEQARKHVGRTADLTMCVTYYQMGRMIVEEEQGGEARAAYGKSLLKKLSEYLTKRVGNGFSVSTLTNARKFYRVYSPSISQAMLTKLEPYGENQKSQAMLTKLNPFNLSWSHYLVLMRIDNDDERRFYEIEAIQQQWDYRYLSRQYNSSLYERIALSRDKDAVIKLANEGQTISKPRDMIKDPIILDFIGLEDRAVYSEDDLETAVITKLDKFLRELGKGFLFESRQKRFTFEEKHFKVDLVCYNRLLRCYVVIDFKIDEITHQDLGQMQMYVHYYDRYVKLPDENPTVGILLCKKKNDAIVELTLPDGENIYATEYSTYLPDKSLLQSKLAEWIEEFEDEQAQLKLVNGNIGKIKTAAQ